MDSGKLFRVFSFVLQSAKDLLTAFAVCNQADVFGLRLQCLLDRFLVESSKTCDDYRQICRVLQSREIEGVQYGCSLREIGIFDEWIDDCHSETKKLSESCEGFRDRLPTHDDEFAVASDILIA